MSQAFRRTDISNGSVPTDLTSSTSSRVYSLQISPFRHTHAFPFSCLNTHFCPDNTITKPRRALGLRLEPLPTPDLRLIHLMYSYEEGELRGLHMRPVVYYDKVKWRVDLDRFNAKAKVSQYAGFA